jgi:hypothetical protein
VGTHRYCSGCRNAGAHSNRFADSSVKRYAVRRDNAKSDTDAKFAWVTYADTHTDTFSYAFRYNTTFAHTDGDCHSYHSAQGNPQAAADSASSAVSEAVIREVIGD